MICRRCNRKLSDKKSIVLGVGPICRKKEEMEILEQMKNQGLSGDLTKEGIQIHLIPLEKGGEI